LSRHVVPLCGGIIRREFVIRRHSNTESLTPLLSTIQGVGIIKLPVVISTGKLS
jgi:hypothetical protein